MLDLIYQHIFSDSRFVYIIEPERVAIEAAIKYYITFFLRSTPYLFLYYFDKLKNYHIEDKQLYKYCYIVVILQLTTKWAEDKYYSNKVICLTLFSTLISLHDFNRLERNIFAALEYNLYINDDTYNKYTEKIINKYLNTEPTNI